MTDHTIVKTSIKGEFANYLNKGAEECEERCEVQPSRIWLGDMLGKGAGTLTRVEAA